MKPAPAMSAMKAIYSDKSVSTGINITTSNGATKAM